MKKSIILTVFLLLACSHAGMSKNENQQAEAPKNSIVGVWKLVEKNGQPVKGYYHIKIITETQFLWFRYTSDGIIFQSMGGTYTLEGNSYTEFIKTATPNMVSYRGTSAVNTVEIKDNRLTQKGTISAVGLEMLDEVWERIDDNNILLPLN